MLQVGREDRKSEGEIHSHVTRLLPDVELLVSVIREERRGMRTLPVNNVPQGKPVTQRGLLPTPRER